MTSLKFYFFLLFLIFTSTLLFSQELDTIAYNDSIGHLKPFQILNMAKNAARVGDIYKAAEYYEVYAKLKPNNTNVALEIAKLHMRARDYEKADEWFLKVYEKDSIGYPEALYYHALMLKAMGEYEGSTNNFLKYKKQTSKQKDNPFKKAMKNELLGNEKAKELMDSSLKAIAIVTHLDPSINKAHIEFSPFPIDESTLIYASLRSDTMVYYSTTDTTKPMPYKKLYTAKKEDTTWVYQGELEGPFNSKDAHTGNGAFSVDGQRFYFTRCKKNASNKMICAIYVSKKEDGKWSEPEKLNEEINMKDFTSTQPTVGIDSRKNQETIYFVSDRKGTKGGLDIWFTSFDDKKQAYTTPKNAGKINTPGDEMTPFYDNDTRTLYFSSTGFPGLGGLDIFKALGELNKFSEPENLKIPFNSSADDLYYTVTKNKEEGFWTSNRKGGAALKNPTCCDDIYHFKLTHYLHLGVKGKVMEKVTRTVNEPNDTLSVKAASDSAKTEIDTVYLTDATVSLFLVDKNGQTVFISKTNPDSAGNYFFKLEHGNFYKIAVAKEGYFSKEEQLTTIEFTRSDTIENQSFTLERIPKKPIAVKNIYFDFDKTDISDSSKLALDTTLLKLLKENPQIIIEVSTHTDSKGSDKYNMTLSQKRAESVVKHLVSKEIDQNRVVAKGYGESQPLAPNENSDGSDNPEGRAKNRRTEFKVIGKLEGYSKVEYEE